MHVNVSHISSGEVGDSAEFRLAGANPDISDLELTQPITGQVRIIKLDDGLQLTGQAHLAFNLECYRCLDPYVHQADLKLSGLFTDNPGEDDWPIGAGDELDLDPLIRQEALLSIPIQQLCREDCAGLCVECGQKRNDGHQHETETIIRQPRVTKAVGEILRPAQDDNEGVSLPKPEYSKKRGK